MRIALGVAVWFTLQCAADGRRSLAERKPFRQAEVDDFDIAVLVEQNVLHFDIAIDNAFAMQVVEHHGNLGDVQLNDELRKTTDAQPERKQFTIFHVISDDVQVSTRLPVEMSMYNERMGQARLSDGYLV